MRMVTGIILFSMLLLVNCKGKQLKKSMVVEVQSHNQAMKSANPITDLEQTIRQGMRDPFTDPQFVMNRINSEFFGNGLKNNINAGTPMVENSLHDRELMAFSNLGINGQSLSINSPSEQLTQHAIKENNVPMALPQRSKSQNMGYLKKISNLLASKKHLSSPRVSAIHTPINANKMSLQPKIPSDLNVAHLTAESIQPYAVNSASTAATLSDVSRSTEASFVPQNVPSSADSTADIGDTLNAMLTQKGVGSSDVMSANPGLISGKEIEDNFSSIKAFLEADNSLRQKKILDPMTNPLDDLMHKKHHVPKVKNRKKIIRSR